MLSKVLLGARRQHKKLGYVVRVSSTQQDVVPKGPSKMAQYAELTKARLSSLVVLTTGAGFVCAGPASLDLTTMATACMGTGLCAASAGTFNQIIEKDRDAVMNRTKRRPLPSGHTTPMEAGALGIGTGIAGVAMLSTLPNPDVAGLGLMNIVLYAGVYTYSKPVSSVNTWIGSIVGAVPPVMGWMAAGGSMWDAQAVSLGSLLLLWQFPHFFSLSWLHREDYARGGFQMVSTGDAHGNRTAGLISEYSAYLSVLPLVTTAAGLTSTMFLLEASAANAYLLYLAKKFKENRSNANARKVFLCSLWYLPLLLTAYVVHSEQWASQADHDEATAGVTATREGADQGQSQGQTLVDAKKKLKNYCIHDKVAEAPHLCPGVLKTQTKVELGAEKLINCEDKAGQASAAITPADE